MVLERMWYCRVNMSETPTPPQEFNNEHDERDTFFQDAARIAKKHPVATTALAGSIIATAIAGPPIEKGIREANINANSANISQVSEKEHKAFVDALNAQYTEDSVITNITITQGQGLESAALDAVVAESGMKSETQLRPLIISSIKNSAEYYTKDRIIQPGDQFTLVENGVNVLIVEPDQIILPEISELPTPVIESESNQ